MEQLVIYETQPDEITDLLDGTYLENNNIEEFVDEETGLTRWRATATIRRKPVRKVPEEVWAWRLETILEIAGLLSNVNAILAAIPGDEGIAARNAFKSGRIRRNSPLIEQFALELGLSHEAVDDIFIQANDYEL